MESRQEINIRDICELCKSMPCCPEHCCDWDRCHCSHCQKRRNIESAQAQPLSHQEPSILIKATGQEETIKVKKDKKQANQNNLEDEDEEISKIVMKSSHQTRINDGSLIINYEIANEDDEDKIVYAGGVRGIRALRKQRQEFNDQVGDSQFQQMGRGNQQEESKR